MPEQKRKLILIGGIPGSGKTWYGNFFAQHYGFVHFDGEDPVLFDRIKDHPSDALKDMLKEAGDVVLTWGFTPCGQADRVRMFMKHGFKVVWFDGNREAALREYVKRGSPVHLFNLQMGRIGDPKFADSFEPIRINPFAENGEFKPPKVILEEIEKGLERI
jgi:hypothetical protein